MASIPQFYSDYSFSSDFSQFSSYPTEAGENCTGDHGSVSSGTISSCAGSGGAIWGEDSTFAVSFDPNNVLPSESDGLSPAPMMAPFPEQVGILDSVMPTLPDFNMGGFYGGIQNFGSRIQLPDLREFGDECCGYPHDFKPVLNPAAAENWGIQATRMPTMEEATIKVGRYSVEERKNRILRYLKKKNRRNFNKTIKYACRKTLADRRVRVRGRFARNSELCDEEMMIMKNNNIDDNNSHKEEGLYRGEAMQIKQDEDQWLQEAMASLMFLPYIAG